MVTFIDNIPTYDNFVYISDWLRQNGYKAKEEFICVAVCNDMTEEDIDTEWDRITEKFFDWCEKNELNGDDC